MALIGSNNEERIWNYLKAKGFNEYGCAGLMGNLYAESGLQPTNLQDTFERKLGYNDATYTVAVDSGKYKNFVKDSAGYGLAQWTFWSRKQALLDYAKSTKRSIGDLEMQLDFLCKEISEGFTSVLSTLKSAKSVAEASNKVLFDFEKPADQSNCKQAQRISYATGYYEKYHSVQKSGGVNMGYTNSGLVSYVKISPNITRMRNHAIDTISIHCVAAQCTVETLGAQFQKTKPEVASPASSNYGIGYDGRIAMFCEEKDRSWCTSNAANDNRAITIEVASDAKSPYAVTPQAYAALLDLLTDICKRNGIKKLLWKADKSLIGQVDKQNMTVHRWFAPKECPGDYLYNRHGEIAAEVNKRLGVSSADGNISNGTAPTPSVSTGTTNSKVSYVVRVTADNLNIRSGAGTNYAVVGSIKNKGSYTIVEEANGVGATKWGLLKAYANNRGGWISLDYCTKV